MKKQIFIAIGMTLVLLIVVLSGCTDQKTDDNGEGQYENNPPTALIQTDITSGTVPLKIDFTGSGTDTDGDIVSYYWDFGDGSSSSEQNITHKYNEVGTYSVKLTVIDDKGANDSDTIIIEAIEDLRPGHSINNPVSIGTTVTYEGKYIYKRYI